jgi:hypothetical protein
MFEFLWSLCTRVDHRPLNENSSFKAVISEILTGNIKKTTGRIIKILVCLFIRPKECYQTFRFRDLRQLSDPPQI